MLNRLETLIALIAALLMVSAGLTWAFGAFGLIGAGVLVFVAAGFMSVEPKRPARPGDRQ